MKKIYVLFLCVTMIVSMCMNAWADEWYYENAVAHRKALEFSHSLFDLAKKIVAYNKPISKKHEAGAWMGTWKKNGTEVIGVSDKKNGKYEAVYITTTDPMMIFAGNIHVGASIKVLEDFLGLTVRKLDSDNNGLVEWEEELVLYTIQYRNNKIIKIATEDVEPDGLD